MTEIEIQSGYQKGRISILNAVRKAVVNAVINGAMETVQDTVRSAPQETGALRVGYAMGLEKSAFRLTVAKNRIVIRGSEVLRIIEQVGSGAAPYLPHHIRQSSRFNPKFAGGYRNPTIAGTRPIDMNEVMRSYHKNVRDNIKKELRLQGLDAN